MTQNDSIVVTYDGHGVTTLRLARSRKHNALDLATIRELRSKFAAVAADASTRVVVLAAEGDTFCAGGDLAWMQALAKADHAERVAQASELALLLSEIDALPKPLVARVQGPAFGGGVGLLCVCDIVIGVESARFALSEVRLGLIPATIGPYVLARIGNAAARRMMLSGRSIDAQEAQRIGLVSRVCTADALDAAIAEEVGELAKGAPGAQAAIKAMIRAYATDAASNDPMVTALRLANCLAGREAQDGITAFLEERQPPWRGATQVRTH